MSRWYRKVPKTLVENLKFRRSLLDAGSADPAVAEQIRIACREDILFYLNAFVWIYEARDDDAGGMSGRELPFITWKFQDKFLLRMQKRLGRQHALVEKSRDMGASWLCLALFEHRWHFFALESFLLASRNQDYVDKAGNPKSLFWKIDFIHDRLPPWLMPSRTRQEMHLRNNDNGSIIDGESTTAEVARGDRRTAILLDEFAAVTDGFRVLSATRDATNCRIFNSTHQGSNTAFCDERDRLARVDPEALFRLHWSEHPLKARGLYRSGRDGEIEKLDPSYEFPADYQFIADGKLRSPWYDRECRERHPREVAQELDIDPAGAASQFFQRHEVEPLIEAHCRPPFRQGEVEIALDPPRVVGWIDRANGPIRLWCHLDHKDRPLADRRYAAGADIATGSATAAGSNSVLSIADIKLGEKIFEYADPRIRPDKFAEIVLACGRWFGGLDGEAYLIWEANGIGSIFTSRIVELGARRFYMRRNEVSLRQKPTDTPGWYSTPNNKRTLIGEYRRALLDGLFVNRSVEALTETLQYVYTMSGSVEHALATNSVDPTGAQANHGDRVLADALCLKAMGPVREREEIVEGQIEAPPGSFAWRLEQTRREEREQALW